MPGRLAAIRVAKSHSPVASRNLTVIFGAGASNDSGAYAQWRDDNCPLPLAKYLFADDFDHILARYPQLGKRIAEVQNRLESKKKSENIEMILRDLYFSAERHGKYWPYQIPLYLRHLFWEFSFPYEHNATNFDAFLRPVLESSLNKVMFVSLNYDLLLDFAIEGYESPGWKFETVNSYVPEGKKWLLIKPHGSINWATEIDNCPPDCTRGGYFPSQLNARPHFPKSQELKFVRWNPQQRDCYVPMPNPQPDGFLYPQIVIPAEKPKEFVCPPSHIEHARTFIKNCTNFLFIGFSGHDQDIAQLLETMPSCSRLTVVGYGRQDAQGILRSIICSGPSLKHKKLVARFYNQGFSKFIKSQEFKKILDV